VEAVIMIDGFGEAFYMLEINTTFAEPDYVSLPVYLTDDIGFFVTGLNSTKMIAGLDYGMDLERDEYNEEETRKFVETLNRLPWLGTKQ
jgi:hypothetical protein